MRNDNKKVIFDLDGTLYSLGGKQFGTFGESQFYTDLKGRILTFIGTRLNLGKMQAARIIENVDRQFNGDLSIGFEKLYGIDRYEYYTATWQCDPTEYVTADNELAAKLTALRGRTLLLTAAPRVWAEKTLDHLGVADIFGGNIITGEPDIRKPDPLVFMQASKKLDLDPRNIISVGDQNHTDIIPARAVGMTTILIGPKQQDAHFRVDTIHQAIDIIKEQL
jgi:HAD superfamily hydrolase (TIGR01509 family)